MNAPERQAATPQVRHHIFMPSEMMERLRKAKDKTGVPVAEFIRRAIESALKERKP